MLQIVFSYLHFCLCSIGVCFPLSPWNIHELLFDLVDQIKPQTSSNISRNSSVANIKSRHYKLNRNLCVVYFFYLLVLFSLS